MIIWKDFVLDDFFGPTLFFEGETTKVCRTSGKETRMGASGVMEDAGPKIQETRQEQRPARMVGLLSLDYDQTGMEAGRSSQTRLNSPKTHKGKTR